MLKMFYQWQSIDDKWNKLSNIENDTIKISENIKYGFKILIYRVLKIKQMC